MYKIVILFITVKCQHIVESDNEMTLHAIDYMRFKSKHLLTFALSLSGAVSNVV